MSDTEMDRRADARRLSVIIPTLNEAAYLPDLLDALAAQTLPPDEIVVADAGSTDGTVELARERGASVVRGGMPAAGRNAGARAASGELLFFLDADVVPPPDFIARAVDEFERKGYVIATSLIADLGGDLVDQIIAEATNLYFVIVQPVSPHAPGFCILVRRGIHEKLGGFDESLKLSEDIDYARRAAQHGEFGILTSTRIPVSMRRVEKEGLVGLGLKYAWCEMYALAGKPMRALPFEYEFGAFGSPQVSASRPVIDVGDLRQRLGRSANPLQRFSRAGREQLDLWMEIEPAQFTRERFQRLLGRADLNILYRYLRHRLALTLSSAEPWRAQLSKLTAVPKETIRLFEADWLPVRLTKDKPDKK